ncbi:MAG TPA: hypothetical protein VKU91_10065, partial [Acidimicrobiales bacterium]|nr:hypothetical protein [Acidimicrobiales bacterium]
GAFVLFGGTAAGGNVLDDTWTFNGSAWTADSPPASPPPLTGAASTWDAAHRQVVVFGGQSSAPSSTWSAGTWSWSGTTWTQVAAPGPSARTGATLAYDGDVAGDVLVGGTGAGGTDSDAWLFTGSGWTGLTALNPPPARYLATSAWDSAAHQLVLFGGAGTGGTVLGDTEVLSVPAAAPPPTSTTTTRPASRPAAPSTAPPSARPKASSPTTVSKPRRSPPSTALRQRAPKAVAAAIKPRAVPATLRATARRVKRGQTVKLMGSGFAPGALVSLSLHSQPVALGTTHADARGRFEVRVLVPTDVALGAHHLEASGRLASGADRTLSTAVDVVALGSGRPLWETLSMVALALLIPVVTWIVMDVRSKRRRARAPAPSG